MAQGWRIHLAMQKTWVQFLSQEDPLEKEMTPHSSILAWKIPWTEEPGRLESMGSQRVGHELVTEKQPLLRTNIINFFLKLFFFCLWVLCMIWYLSNAMSNSPFTSQSESQSVSRSVMFESLWPYGLCSPPGSSVHGILQARTLEWVAISFSRGSSGPRD